LAFPKSGKPQSLPTSYRPISLLSILSKVYEKILNALILEHLKLNNVIINEQFDFRPKHSTVAQLLRITEQFAFEINKKRNSVMLLLNLKKAFDSVWLIVQIAFYRIARLPNKDCAKLFVWPPVHCHQI